MRTSGKRNSISRWIVQLFISFQWSSWVMYSLSLFVVGQLINVLTNCRFGNFIIHQLLLISATTLLVRAMKEFFADTMRFKTHKTDSLLKRNPELAGLYNERYLPLQRSCWPFIASIIITSFFFICIVLLEYIDIDVVGIYAIYIAGSSVLIGVYAYCQYLFYLWFIYKAGKCIAVEYDSYSPADTKWISSMAKTSQRIRNYFLFIGFIYVIEYAMLVPRDKIVVTDTVLLNMPNNEAFVASWVALFFLVIVAFPVINRVQYKLIVNIVSNLKNRSISNLSDLMFAEHKFIGIENKAATNIYAYSVLIETIRKTKDYPIKRQLSYETVMLMVTFVVHVLNLYDKLSSISLITSFVSQL